MGMFDNYSSSIPGRTKNFIQKFVLNPETGQYEIQLSPHVGYSDTINPSWTTQTNPTWNPCPEGQVMGPDGVCRVDPNYTGQPITPETPESDLENFPIMTDGTPTGGQGQGGGGVSGGGGSNYYDEQQKFYSSISQAASPTASPGDKANLRRDKYKTLPGGMKNWSDSQLYQWALDNNYFTQEDRMALDIPVPGEHRYEDYNSKVSDYFKQTMTGQLFQKIGDWRSKAAFEDWLTLAQERNIIKKDGNTWKVLKGPGGNKDSLYAGGYLIPLSEETQKEFDYAPGYFTPSGIDKKITQMNLSGSKDDLTYDWAMRFKLGTEFLPELRNDQQIDILTNNIEKWQEKLASMHKTGEGTGWWEWFDKKEMDNLYQNIVKAEERIVFLTPTTSGFESYTPGHMDLQKNYVWGTINSTDGKQIDIGLLSTLTGKEQSDFWKAQAGVPKSDMDKFQLAGSPHTEQPRIISTEMTSVVSPKIDLSSPVSPSDMNSAQLTSVYGDNISEVTKLVGKIGSKEQKTDIVSYAQNDGSPGNHNKDGTTADWGYDADGRFVNVKTGQTAAMGSYADGVAAIKNGNASSKLLDRFHWGDGSSTGYKNKEEYLANQKNNVTYRDNDGNQKSVSGGNYDSKDDNSKGKIICDYFYRKGLLPKKLWKADEAYGAELMISEPDVMKGYHAWARHYVREMEKESLLGKVYFAWAKLWVPHWAKYLAGEKTIRGKILHSIGKPICNVIGKFKRRLTWQQA